MAKGKKKRAPICRAMFFYRMQPAAAGSDSPIPMEMLDVVAATYVETKTQRQWCLISPPNLYVSLVNDRPKKGTFYIGLIAVWPDKRRWKFADTTLTFDGKESLQQDFIACTIPEIGVPDAGGLFWFELECDGEVIARTPLEIVIKKDQ